MTELMRKIFLTCLFILLPLSVLAAPDFAANKQGPVEITADSLEVDDQAQTLVFTGNAVATQGDVSIHGNRLTVKYTGEKREIEQVLAEGSVRIVQGARVATGERAVMYHLEERIVLTGSPEVRDGDNYVRGHEITIFLNDQRSIVSGGPGERVNAVFTPQAEAKP